MVATIQSVQRFVLPLLLIGLGTGLLALIPKIGWLLGIAVFVLASQYVQRRTMPTDLILIALMWVGIRHAATLFIA